LRASDRALRHPGRAGQPGRLGGSSCSGSRTSVASPDPGGPSASAQPTSSGAPLERSREGAFATRRHRNLFAEIGKPAADIDAKIADAYQRLFHGSPDQVVRFDAGRNERGRSPSFSTSATMTCARKAMLFMLSLLHVSGNFRIQMPSSG
jgi:hypothetical protein